jgi:hypothetical protein
VRPGSDAPRRQPRSDTAQQGKEPLLTADVRNMIAALPANLQGTRDRALLVLGFASGARS